MSNPVVCTKAQSSDRKNQDRNESAESGKSGSDESGSKWQLVASSRRRRKQVVGMKTDSDTIVKGIPKYVKSKDYYVGRLDPNTTIEELQSFLKGKGIVF